MPDDPTADETPEVLPFCDAWTRIGDSEEMKAQIAMMEATHIKYASKYQVITATKRQEEIGPDERGVAMTSDQVTETVKGHIMCCTLNGRMPVYVRAAAVTAIVALKKDGPARLLFSGGGCLDVCGSAEYWLTKIRITELEERDA